MPRPDPGLVNWVEGHENEQFHISVLTLGEIAKGIARLPASAKRTRLQGWLDRDLSERFSGRILPIDQNVALRWAELQARAEKVGRPMPVIDGLIAASAAVNELTIVTRNGGDMAQSGVAIIDPWKA